MTGKKILTILLCALTVALFFGCEDTSTKEGDSTDNVTKFERSQTLYVSGFMWAPPSTFNPLHGDPSFPTTANVNLIYESMFGYNLLDGKIEPIIGKSYSIDENAKTLTVQLDEKAAWSDGKPLTADDVMYTFEIHKKYETTLSSHWLYIKNMRAEGKYTVVFEMNPKKYNPLTLQNIISSTYILPKHVFKKIEDEGIAAANGDAFKVLEKLQAPKFDQKPIGSGPYTIHSYTDEKVALVRVENYWGNYKYGKDAAPKFIVHPLFKSNDVANLALQQGKLDVTQDFIPQIWTKFKKGVGTWYNKKPFYVPGTLPSILPNNTKAPMNDPKFRRAIAHAVNYEQITTLAIYGYAPPLKSGLILDEGAEKKYFNASDSEKYGVKFDVNKAKQLLKEAGYKVGKDGMLRGKDGKTIPTMYVTCPSGWSDWEATIRIFVDGLRSCGVDVREKFVSWSVWWDELTKGRFDYTMYCPKDNQSVDLPWARFNAVMSTENWQDPGKDMWQNQHRYKNPKAQKLLNEIPAMKDDAKVQAAYRELNKIFMRDMPTIPVMNRPWFFYEFSTKHWTNFPTAENPYAPPQCLLVGAAIKSLWHIKPVK